MKQWLYGVVIALCLGSGSLSAREIAGVEIPDASSMAGGEQSLQLNGAGVRYKFIFKIYIGALYLPQAGHAADAVINHSGEKRILMHFLYDRVNREDLADAWREGFEDNLTGPELEMLKPRIEAFTRLFPDAVEGDRIWIDRLPGGDTRVTINGVEQGRVPGGDFYPALMKIWLGDDPVTVELKRAMLGQGADES